MKYRVYHATPFQFPPPRWPDCYRLVAEVDAPNPQSAFTRTNSSDRHWSLQPGVTCHDPEARSTSIGDVIVAPDGRAFRCEPIGWKELPPLPETTPTASGASEAHCGGQWCQFDPCGRCDERGD